MKKNILIFFLLLFLIPIIAFSHSGRTDSQGGHYNRSTGEYHYHHGYPAHQHENNICPYKENKTDNNTTNKIKEVKNNENDNFIDILFSLVETILIPIFSYILIYTTLFIPFNIIANIRNILSKKNLKESILKFIIDILLILFIVLIIIIYSNY